MLFNSLQYVVFLAAVVLAYWQMPHRAQNLLLVVASYVFYGSWNWWMLWIIIASGVIDYTIGHEIHRRSNPASRRFFLCISLAFNLGTLGFFKYYNFFAAELADLLTFLQIPHHPLVLSIVLPVGISFFIFQSMGYALDIYFNRLKPAASIWDYLLFVSFFPQLVAGPIERASNLLSQIQRPRKMAVGEIERGVALILYGLFKKMVVADHLAALVDAGFDHQTGWRLLVTIYFFAFQIYCDFSGYTDIARGSAKLLGFELRQNFDRPYLAASIGEFWRRWHMSLSTWFRDYVYIPLGGNRLGRGQQIRNILITFVLSGLWHGANWTFIVWGAFHGALLSVEVAASRSAVGQSVRSRSPMRKALLVLATFHLVCIGWVFFRAPTIGGALHAFERLAQPAAREFVDYATLGHALGGLCLLALAELGTNHLRRLWQHPNVRLAYYPAVVVFILTWGKMNGGQFVYFQF